MFQRELPNPLNCSTFYPNNPQSPLCIRDLRNSHRLFAVFTDSGSVLTTSCTLLNSYFDPRTKYSRPLPSPVVISGLQYKSVIFIAFGDHHFLALHFYGVISSYGIECQTYGSLGLGVWVFHPYMDYFIRKGGFQEIWDLRREKANQYSLSL